MFVRNGVPGTLLSDNATEFKAEKNQMLVETNFNASLCSPPYNPSSNGQAERFVRTLQDALKLWSRSVLFAEGIPHFSHSKTQWGTSVSSDLLMWNRRLRDHLTMSEGVDAAV